MPFGLCNAPGLFQRYINHVFREHIDDFVVIYLDVILIYSQNVEQHEEHLKLVMRKLREHGLMVQPHKCKIGMRNIEFLGVMVGPEGAQPCRDKLDVVRRWPTPKNVH